MKLQPTGQYSLSYLIQPSSKNPSQTHLCSTCAARGGHNSSHLIAMSGSFIKKARILFRERLEEMLPIVLLTNSLKRSINVIIIQIENKDFIKHGIKTGCEILDAVGI